MSVTGSTAGLLCVSADTLNADAYFTSECPVTLLETRPAPPPADRVPAGRFADLQHTRRWWILAILGIAQLMVVLDSTIVNIALPHAQASLGFSDGDRQWIVTAYSLAFGSLLLLGGRLADDFGRKRVFMTGVIGF